MKGLWDMLVNWPSGPNYKKIINLPPQLIHSETKSERGGGEKETQWYRTQWISSQQQAERELMLLEVLPSWTFSGEEVRVMV